MSGVRGGAAPSPASGQPTGATLPGLPPVTFETPPFRWWLVTLPLAPLASAAFLFSEWLFQVTKPSPISALPLAAQLRVLLTALDVRTVVCILGAQLCASSVSLVRYPRARTLALWPASGIGGLLLLFLIDNFTYTLFGVGITRAATALRIVYAALLAVLIYIVWAKLAARAVLIARRVAWPVAAAVISLLFLGAPRIWHEPLRSPREAVQLQTVGPQKAASDLPNILFFGVDGLDAELTSAYGYERPTTPFLEELARESLVFENAFSNASRTHGALVTLLTGRTPFSTHVTFPPTILQGDDGDRTLPVVLKAMGYSTLQIGMRHYADAEDTNVRGFDAANYRWRRLDEIGRRSAPRSDADTFRSIVAERVGERLSRIVLGTEVSDGFAHVEGRAVVPQWQDDRRVSTLIEYFNQASKPWFVHAHLLDTHCCVWRPVRMHFEGGPSRTIDARDSQVRESDGNVRRVIEALAASGQLERTIVVISSDHGSGWKATERVPLMIRFPHRAHAGRITQNVQLADVTPTVLSHLGVTKPEWMDGASLVSGSLPSPNRPIFAVSEVQAYSGPAGARVLRDSSLRNYGVASVMVAVGPDLFEWNLETGAWASRKWRAAQEGESTITEAEARSMLASELSRAGMVVAGAVPPMSAPGIRRAQ